MTALPQGIGGSGNSERTLPEPLGEAIGNRTVGRIRQRIVELAPGLKSGQSIDIARLAQHFSVRITPIINAMNRLDKKGTVHVRSRSGHYGTQFAEDDCQGIARVRSALEQAAMRLIVGNGIRQGLLDARRHVAARP